MLVVPLETANKALLNAALYGDIELLEMALECGADVQTLQSRERFEPIELGNIALNTALHLSFNRKLPGYFAVVERLVALNVDLNKRLHPDPGSYPLCSAITSGHPEMVHLLLENGATLWTQGGAGANMARWAASLGMTWLVSKILQELSPPNPPPDEMMSRGLEVALCKAAYEGHLEIVEMLLDFGVDIEANDEYAGGTPLMLAAQKGQNAVVQLLRQQQADILAVGKRGETVLIGATRSGSSSLVEELLDQGADPQASDFFDSTALHSIGGPDRDNIVDKLIVKGASLLARDHGNHAVLHSAAWGGDLKLAQACLEAGEKVDTTNDWGYTPLMKAASNGHVPMMELLAKHGANPDHVAHYQGETPLHYAIYNHHRDAIAWLLNRKVQLSNVMEDIGIGGVTPLMLAAYLGQPDTVEQLLNAGADVNFKEPEDGYTVLHYLPSESNRSTALACYPLLKEAGAQIDARTDEGSTPLRSAALWGHLELVIQLIEDGAQVNHVTSFGSTALHTAAERGHHLVVQALLKRGADPNLANREGLTPLDVAMKEGHLRVINILIEQVGSS
jgi:ankyrin repeat protein